MNSGRDEEDHGVPLLNRSLSNRSNSPTNLFCGVSPKSYGSSDMDTNIAAVHDDFEALSFPETKRRDKGRVSNSSSPVSIAEHSPFVAQFDPEGIANIDEKSESAVVTVFDDDTTNEGSRLTSSIAKDEDEDHEISSLKPPSIILEDNEEKSDKDATSEGSTTSKGHSGTRASSCYIDEEADAATWNADQIDAIANADGFGNNGEMPEMEIGGIDLLTERDSSVNELQEANHLMTFNALVLIQKQKDWIAGSIESTNGANKASSRLLMMELENLERKIRLLMDNKIWPNELERNKQKKNPLTPSKAFFKSMALIDKSIEQFHNGYLKYMSENSEENHELKIRVAKLVKLNAALQEEAARSKQKTDTIRKLQKERENLTQKVDRTEDQFASLLVNDERYSGPHSPSRKERTKFHSVKSYIQWLETQRNANLAKIQLLKSSIQDVTESKSSNDGEANDEDTPEAEVSFSSVTTKAAENKEGEDLVDNVVENEESDNEDEDSADDAEEEKTDIDSKSVATDGSGLLKDDLGSKWHIMEENELAMASKDEKIKKLSATVAGQESTLETLRGEMNLIKLELVQLESARNEFKYQCELKDSALKISQDRISTLEEEVLSSHAQCATYEEDYEAMRQSFASQKVATKQEMTNSHDEVKAQVEQIREEYKEKLKKSEDLLKEVEEDRDRAIRDLKSSVEEIEIERDNLKEMLARTSLTPLPSMSVNETLEEEKKESDEDMMLVGTPVVISPKSTAALDFEEMQSRFAEKASNQAFAIAKLTEENEMKDEQLKALQEMVEVLLGKRNGDGKLKEGQGKRLWGRISNLRAKSQQSASDLLNRSKHGGTWHGSMHGSQHGSQHGTWHGAPVEDYTN